MISTSNINNLLNVDYLRSNVPVDSNKADAKYAQSVYRKLQ